MSMQRRTPANKTSGKNIGSGPYLARIVNHLDPSFMGSLEVTLLREQGNSVGTDQQTYIVKSAMPFFGYTGYEFMGNNNAKNSTFDAYNDTQKSYGMWFVPPDVGVTVLVVFVDGDPSQGYWIGCVPANFANNMVPGIAATKNVDISDADKKKYNTSQPLPVAEINRRLNGKESREIDPDRIKKPVHPIADRFLEQGLLEDDVRGFTTSSARREAPSAVFGISTPGPRDKRPGAKKAPIGTKKSQTPSAVPVSRLGGTQIVMDDGDERYVRTKPASSGPVKYVDLLNGTDLGTGQKTTETGDPTIPYSEYFRIRTRTGHQILMHNSEDLIYIGNARGTTWIELTSNGKIDIYAEDSISIHTEQDLNIRADRDINMEAGRNINMKAADDNPKYAGQGGRIRQEAALNWEIIAGDNGSITLGKNFDVVVGGGTKITTSESLEIGSGGDNKFTTNSNTHILSGGNHTETAVRIDMNGPKAEEADPATPLTPLKTHENPRTAAGAGWNQKYNAGVIPSIMKRIPMHEPWLLHENQAPEQLTPDNTDREK
jgi:hypothetical protein